jgi:hypothetical protein
MTLTTVAAGAAAQQASISTGAGIGLSLAAVGLLGGIAAAMHHRRKSPRIIGWIAFLCGIPLAGLLSGAITYLAALTLWSIPMTLVAVGYVGFVFFHDGFKRGRGGGGGGRSGGFGSGGGGGAHRWLQPLYGLILPALLLTLGGSLGNGIHQGLQVISNGVGTAITKTTGK